MKHPDIETILTDKYLEKINKRKALESLNKKDEEHLYMDFIKNKLKNLPKVSIIVSVKNVAHLLNNSISSIIDQTYKNIEILLIVNISSDSSLEICRKYEKKHKNIHVYEGMFKTESEIKNLGIKKASGNYITFMSGADFISLNYIEYMLYLCIKYNSEISECDLIKVSEAEAAENLFIPPIQEKEKIEVLLPWNAIENLHSSLQHTCLKTVVLWNKLFSINLFSNITFPNNKNFEDEFTTYKLFRKANKIVSSNQILYAYVQKGESKQNLYYDIKRLDILDAYENYMLFFKEMKSPYMLERAGLRYLKIILKIRKEISPFNIVLDNKQKRIDDLDSRFVSIYKYINVLLNKYPYLLSTKNEHQACYNEYQTYIKIINSFNNENLKYKHNKNRLN